MEPVSEHPYKPHASFDGGDLDCGNGLLLLIREHLDRLSSGELLEIRSTESSVENDLPSWCRLTKNDLLSWTKQGKQRSFVVSKGSFQMPSPRQNSEPASTTYGAVGEHSSKPSSEQPRSSKVSLTQSSGIATHGSLAVPPLSVMGIGSWPRPKWMLQALHEYLEDRRSEEEFQETADDAVRLIVDRQLRAEVDVITDGEQRRDNYASFVGKRLTNCQLVPLVDLLAMVDDPGELEQQMMSLDVPATEVRHPVVTGGLKRERPLAVHELQFVKQLTDKPIKIALPGPYLLTRTMWLHCITDKVYKSREELSDDIVRVLREEVGELLKTGAAVVQLDEPVLTEVVFGGQSRSRTFMCGALSERLEPEEELTFAAQLINKVTDGFPIEKLALHICRGNWSPDESVALTGDYRPLIPVLRSVNAGTLFLEFCTSRAGDIDVLEDLPARLRIGLGVTNPKDAKVEDSNTILTHLDRAASFIGFDRLLINPDCGFATFADSPVTSADLAEAKLRAMVQASRTLKERHRYCLYDDLEGSPSHC